MHGPEDGQGFKAGRYKFVTCLSCAPKVRAGVQVAKDAALFGLKALLVKKYPTALGLFQTYEKVHKELADAHVE